MDDHETLLESQLIVAFGTAVGLLFARDNNVTSEDAGATTTKGR